MIDIDQFTKTLEIVQKQTRELISEINALAKRARQEADSYGPRIEASKKELELLEEKKNKSKDIYEAKLVELKNEFERRKAEVKAIQDAEALRVAAKEKEALESLEDANVLLSQAKTRLSQAEDHERKASERLAAAEVKEAANKKESERLEAGLVSLAQETVKSGAMLKDFEKTRAEVEKGKGDLEAAQRTFLSRRQESEEMLADARKTLDEASKKELATLKIKESMDAREVAIKEGEAKNEKDRQNNLAKEKNLKALEAEQKAKK